MNTLYLRMGKRLLYTYILYIYIYINQNIFHSHITFLFDFIQDNDHKHAMHPYIIAGYTHIRVAG